MTVPVDPPADRPVADVDEHAHLDLDALADLDAGLLDAAAAAAARAHLARCARCAASAETVQSVPLRLAAAADVGPMPPDVADRLHAALAAAARTESTESAEPHTAPAAATTVTPLPTRTAERERSPLSMRILQAAAVVVLLLGGIGVVLSAIQSTGGGDGGGASTETSAEGGQAVPESAATGGYPVTASGRNWSAETVVDAVPEIVAGTVGPPAPSAAADQRGSDRPPGSDDSARELSTAERLASGEELARCVGNLNLGPVTPLAVDLARWEGNPAAVIVLPTPDDPSTADLFVVTPACPAGEFLYFARVPRP